MGYSSPTDAEFQTRIRQQEVVADLGQQALETEDLDQLMHDASVAVADTLDNEYCKVLELLPGGDEVFLRQGVGWREGLVGNATVPTDLDSQAGYTLISEEPVIVDDLQDEERFSGPELLTSHDVGSGISVIIGSVEDPWGVLGTHTTDRREFTEYDANFVQSVANVLASAIENEAVHTEVREIHERITNGILALNGAWEFTHINHQAEVILGYEADELLGTNIWEAFPEIAGTEFEGRYREAMASQEPVSFEAYYPPFDAWFEEHVYPSETGLSVYFRDITEQKRMETELEEIYGRISDAFFAIDEEWRLTHINERAHEWINPEGRELVGKTVWEEFPKASERQFKEQYEQAMYEQETVSFEEYYPDPLDAWFEVRAYPSETGLSVYFRDVTERKQREQRLEKSNERLEQFAYAASHDLQEPLRMVSSYLQMIEDRYANALDEDGEEFLEFAVDGADRMRNMIDGLLEYSRVERRGNPLESVDLESVFSDVRDDLQIQIEEHDAEITVEYLPRVRGDPDQLRQVFQNLLTNAFEYSGDERPQVHISAERSGSKWTISVADEGIGLDPKDADLIFEVFERLHAREEHSGTGIGLALCQRIIERHGSEIWVESEPGEGATFSFTLPASTDDDS